MGNPYVDAVYEGADQGAKLRATLDARKGKQALSQYLIATPEQRPQAFSQVAQFDPEAAYKLQGDERKQAAEDESMDTDVAALIHRGASAIKNAPPDQQAGVYQAVRAEVSRHPKAARWMGEFPVEWDSASLMPHIDQILAATGMYEDPTKGQPHVSGTKVGDDGYYYTVDSTGKWVNSGIKAQANLQFLETPAGVVGANKNSGTASPLVYANGQPQPQQAPSSEFTLDDAALESLRGLSPAERTAALKAMMIGGDFYVGTNGQAVAGLPAGAAGPAPGAQVQNKPAAAPSETFSQPQTVLGPDGKPALVQFGNQGTQRPVQGVAPVESKQGRVSATQLRQANAAKLKLIDLKSVRDQLALVREKFTPLQNTLSAGMGGDYLPTVDGKRFDAAVGLLQQQIRKLTRTPGEGSMSDWEGKLAMLANPSRGDYEQVTQDKIDQLDALVSQLESGYGAMLQDNSGDQSSPGAPASVTHQTSAVDALLEKYP